MKGRGRGGAIALVAMVFLAMVLLLGGCQAEQGSVVLVNQSNSHVLWVQAAADRLELLPDNPMTTLAPGGEFRRDSSLGANPPDWCDDPALVNFLLRPVDGEPLMGETATLADFEIVAELGPGHCWGAKDSDWVFTGA